jgi:hypothetical protein
MGSRTDARIEAWQEQSGIKPVTGKRAELLSRLSNTAFENHQAYRAEALRHRDGDGHWRRSDPMHATIRELAVLCNQLTKSCQ